MHNEFWVHVVITPHYQQDNADFTKEAHCCGAQRAEDAADAWGAGSRDGDGCLTQWARVNFDIRFVSASLWFEKLLSSGSHLVARCREVKKLCQFPAQAGLSHVELRAMLSRECIQQS
jgi:hypothetical protein